MLYLSPLLTIIIPFIAALVGIACYNHGPTPLIELFSASCLHPFHSPHYSSWNTWLQPSRCLPNKDSRRNREKGWNILYHLGGNGPWVEKVDGDPEAQGIKGCSVDQVHLVWCQCLLESFFWLKFC